MSKADEFKIIDSHGIAVMTTQDPDVVLSAAVRAIVCLQAYRRVGNDDDLAKVEAEADHIIKSAGFSL